MIKIYLSLKIVSNNKIIIKAKRGKGIELKREFTKGGNTNIQGTF